MLKLCYTISAPGMVIAYNPETGTIKWRRGLGTYFHVMEDFRMLSLQKKEHTIYVIGSTSVLCLCAASGKVKRLYRSSVLT